MSSPIEKKKTKKKSHKPVQFDEHSSTGREELVDTLAFQEFNQNSTKPKHKKRKLEEYENEKPPKRTKSEGFSGLVRFRLGGMQNNSSLVIDGNTEPSTSTLTKHVEYSSGKSPKKVKKHKLKALRESESTNANEITSTSDDPNRKVKKKHSKKQNTENELAINAQSEIFETASVVEKEKRNKHKVKKQKELKPQDDQFDICHDVQEANPKIVQIEDSANDKNREVVLKKKKKKAKKAKEDDSDVILENLFHDNELCTVYEKHKKIKKEYADVNDDKRMKKGQLQDEGTSNLVEDKSGNATTPIKKTKKQRSTENNTSKSASDDVVIIDELFTSSQGSAADSILTTVSAKAKRKRTKIIDSSQKQKAIDGECATNVVECELQQPKQKKRRKVDVASTDISKQPSSVHFGGKKSESVLIEENVAANSSKTNIKSSSSVNANLKDNSILEILEIKDGKSKKQKKLKNSVVKKVEHGSLKDSRKKYDSAGLVQDSVPFNSSKVQDHKMSATTNSDLQGTGSAASSLPCKKKKKKKRKKSFTESNCNLMVSEVASSCVSADKKQTLPVPVSDTTTVSHIENAQVSSKKKKKKRKKKKRDENNEAAGTSNDKGKLSAQSTKKLQVRKKLFPATNQLNTHLQLSPKSPLVYHKRRQHKKVRDILKKVEETTQSSEAQRLDETNNDHAKADKNVPRNDRSKHLQEKSWAKLNAARFRYLNEQLYTTTGQEAKKMFAADPDSYKAYQEGYKSQVKKWPINPVDVIIEDLKSK